MIDRAKMDCFKKHGAAAALELRGELVAALKNRIGETRLAINAYFADKKAKSAAIADRIEAMKDQKAELEAKVADYGPRLAEATISGNAADLESIQAELTDLEARKAAISAQIGLLSGVSVAGDEALYNKADKMAQDLAAFWTATQLDLTELSSFADGQIALWGKVANLSTLGADIAPRQSIFSEVERMRADFLEVE